MKLLPVLLLSCLMLLASGSSGSNSTVWAGVKDLEDASIFLQAVDAVRLSPSANFTGTLLVPNDEAFVKMLALMNATAEELLDQKPIVAALLLYHLAPGYTNNLSPNATLPVALLNKTLGVSRRNGSYYVNGDYNSAKVLYSTNQTDSKGRTTHVIHVINRVLIPDIPTTTNATTARNLTIARFAAANITVTQNGTNGTLLRPGTTNLTLGNTTLYSRNASNSSSPFNSSQWRDPDFVMAMAENSTGRQLSPLRRALITMPGATTAGAGAAPPVPLIALVVVGMVAAVAVLVGSAVMGSSRAGQHSSSTEASKSLLSSV